jgi:hypothetical protein
MKMEQDFHQTIVMATCKENVTWLEPDGGWPQCVPSELGIQNFIFLMEQKLLMDLS